MSKTAERRRFLSRIWYSALGIHFPFDTLSTGPVTLWVTGWKKTLIERSAQVVPMVALMWAGNPIKTLLPVQISAIIFSAVRFREDSGSIVAA